jgi:hypothetical protein
MAYHRLRDKGHMGDSTCMRRSGGIQIYKD